jgi:hypothetical protein
MRLEGRSDGRERSSEKQATQRITFDPENVR